MDIGQPSLNFLFTTNLQNNSRVLHSNFNITTSCFDKKQELRNYDFLLLNIFVCIHLLSKHIAVYVHGHILDTTVNLSMKVDVNGIAST
jgi:hypothetical protein